MTGAKRGIALAAVLTLCAGYAPAEPESDDITSRLERIESEKEDARKTARKLRAKTEAVRAMLTRIDGELAEMAVRSAEIEALAAQSDLHLLELERRRNRIDAEMRDQRDAVEDLLTALILWGGRRPPVLLSEVGETHDAIRAAILMGEVAPGLGQRAAELGRALEKFAAVRVDIDENKRRLADAEMALEKRRARVAELAREKRDLLARLDTATKRVRRRSRELAGDARNLRELVETLISKAPSAPVQRPNPPVFQTPRTQAPAAVLAATAAAADSVPPAQGKLLLAFGQTDRGGERQLGQTVVTRRGAQVAAPEAGRVEFAESFRTYGHIVILNVGKGYRLVLAGMENVLVGEGQNVFAGEPLGYMSNRSDPAPHLYFEVRRNGEPVDPDLWMKRGT